MPRLKGMDTWMWLVGGIIITIICFLLFMEIFSSMTTQNHVQVSLETQANLASDINRLCTMLEGQSQKQTLKFSTLATEFFASENTTLTGEGIRTYGRRLCLNVSGKVSCEDLDCPIELDPIIKQKKVLNLLDRLRGELTFRNYEVELIKTRCGVSVVTIGSEPGCICGLGDFEVPIYCSYNGRQPFIILKNKVVVISDAEVWTSPNATSEAMFSNIANYLGGQSILVVFEENLTDPYANNASVIIDALVSKGFSINVKRHSEEMDFSGYDQVWLMTPGFCEAQGRDCGEYIKWGVNEQKSLVSFAKSGKGLLLVTDSPMIRGVYERVELRLLNKFFSELGFPMEQILSCVCGCDGQPYNETVFENHTLARNVSNLYLTGAAVFRETCVYTSLKPNATEGGGCGADGKCVTGCPRGDPDCSCLEQGGYICNDSKYCQGTLLKNAGTKYCCSEPCGSSGGGNATPLVCSPEELSKLVDTSKIHSNIVSMSSGSRVYRSNSQNAEWIRQKLVEYGLENVHFEDFNSGAGRNVVGELGSGTSIIVLGGHRDSVPSCPGSVDNAAGPATIMEVARVIAGCKDRLNSTKIRFVMFDGEEVGLFGAKAYASAHSSEGIKGMMNFDCIGDSASTAIATITNKDRQAGTLFRASADRACDALRINCARQFGSVNSDQVPFAERGIPYLFFCNEGPNFFCSHCYHCGRCTDGPNIVSRNRLEWATKIAVYVIADKYISQN